MGHINPIHGAGSGGGGGKGGGSGMGSAGGSASEAANTLRSRAKARFVDLLGEGEIGGLVNGAASIYFNQTPVVAGDGTSNFSGVSWEQRLGLPDQPYMSDFTSTESEVNVGARVSYGVPVVHTISDPSADKVRVTIRLPQMTTQDQSTGDLNGASVEYKIEVRAAGGAYILAVDQKFENQKCVSPYDCAHVIDLPRGGSPWDIKVTRVTADETKVNVSNQTWWQSYTVITEGKFTYPHSAVVGLEIDAEQFGGSIPTRIYEVYGRVLQTPSNYSHFDRSYAGLWDGTFISQWTDNPAWILYDILSNNRFGLGEYLAASQIDKWGLYQIAQYCDALVPDGYGGTEPRFTFNAVLNTREDCYKVIQTIASAFRGMSFWSTGSVFAVADMPSDPVKLVTPANVIDGLFNYEGTAMKARHSVAMVSWNDPADFFKPTIEVVIDEDMLLRYGWREIQVIASGCSRRGQANRLGKWILDTEKHSTETVTYNAAWDQADLRVGQVVAIADPAKAGVRMGGRIVSQVGTAITLDSPVTMVSGQTYTISIMQADGTIYANAITTAPTTTASITVTVAPLVTLTPGAVWIVTGSDIAPRLYRVQAVTEDTTKGTAKVTGLFYDATKFARVEANLTLPTVTYNRPRTSVNPILNLTVAESVYLSANVPVSRITASWTPPADLSALYYIATITPPSGIAVSSGQIFVTSFELDNVNAGLYSVSVQAFGSTGIPSTVVTQNYALKGWEGGPSATVSGLELFGLGNSTSFLGTDVKIDWRGNFPSTAYEMGQESYGAGSGQTDPFFRDYVVRVYDATDDTLLRTEYVLATTYIYTFDHNLIDAQAIGRSARRSLKFKVTVRDSLGRESAADTITVSNPAPGLPAVAVSSAINTMLVTVTPPAGDVDVIGYQVWASTTSGFTPSAANLAYTGPNTTMSIPAAGGVPLFVRVAAYDAFGVGSVNITSEYSSTPTAIVLTTTEFTFDGLTFTPNSPSTSSVAWTAGNAHVTIGATTTNYAVSASNSAWSAGILYLYYVAGDTALSATATLSNAVGTDRIIVATYKGGVTVAVGNGNAIIDGSTITTNTVGANQMVAGSAVITGSAQIGTAIINDAHITSIAASKITAASLSAINANIGNVTAGVMQSSDGTMNIDLGAKTITMAAATGNASYMAISGSDITYYYWNGSSYLAGKALKNVQSGTATNGATIQIPGYFTSQPSIEVSPASLMCYNHTYANQDQTMVLQAGSVTQYATGQWQFVATANLSLASATGTTSINLTSGALTTDTMYTTAVQTTAANTTSITPHVTMASYRGNGTAPYYFTRKVTWRLCYKLSASGTYTIGAWQTKNMSTTALSGSTDQMTLSVAAGVYNWYIDFLPSDINGSTTFSYGSSGYNYNTATVGGSSGDLTITNSTLPSTQTNTISFAYSPPSTWSIYSVTVNYNWGYLIQANESYSSWVTAAVTCGSNSASVTSTSSAVAGGVAGCTNLAAGSITGTTSIPSISMSAANTTNGGGFAEADVRCQGAVAHISIRQAITNSTTPANTFSLDSVDWTLSAASVLATGTLNWVATGG